MIDADQVIGTGSGTKRDVDLRIAGLTGEPGTLQFSRPITLLFSQSNLTCAIGSTGCTVNPTGVTTGDATLSARFDTAVPLTVQMFDRAGQLVASYTSP